MRIAVASAPRILAIVGLEREARLAEGTGATVITSAARPGRLRAALEHLAPDFDVVLSFGLAGALDPALAPGALVLADAVVTADGRHPTAALLRGRCTDRLAGSGAAVVTGAIAGVDRIVIDAAGKRALRETTGALAVDMESQVAAAYARAHGLPLMVLRAIADPAQRALPALTADVVRPDGGIAPGAALIGLLRRPADLPALVAAARDGSRALASLRRCGPLGLLFGLGPAHF